MKTMSKIGFASLRLGFLLGDKSVIDSINKLRLPYNISTFSQIIANKFYMNPSVIDNHIQTIKNQRGIIIDFLNNLIPDSQRKEDHHVIACDGEILIIGRNFGF